MNRLLNQVRSHLRPGFHQNVINSQTHNSTRTMAHLERPGQRMPIKVSEPTTDGPVKFSTSEAFVDYRASDNFYGGDDRDLPRSHNAVLAATGIFGFYYLIFLRDDVDADGGAYLYKPLHETVPELAIPLIQSAIAENKRLGYNTTKLEKKLAELLQDPDKYGGGTRRKLVEN